MRMICGVCLLVIITGCRAGSQVTVVNVSASSFVEAHEWQDGDFYCENGKLGSTYGFLSSEIALSLNAGGGASIGAFVNWDQSVSSVSSELTQCRVCGSVDCQCPNQCAKCGNTDCQCSSGEQTRSSISSSTIITPEPATSSPN